MKPTEIGLKSVISAKYLIPEKMLLAYLERINWAMPLNKIGRGRADLVHVLNGIYYVLRTGIQWMLYLLYLVDQKPFITGLLHFLDVAFLTKHGLMRLINYKKTVSKFMPSKYR